MKYFASAVLALSPVACTGPAFAATQSVLYDFCGSGRALNAPIGGPLVGAEGALYGVAQYSFDASNRKLGGVFRLEPVAGEAGSWTLTNLHPFSGAFSNPSLPQGALVRDAAGALYGTTEAGGKYDRGVAYRLTPPATGQSMWTYDVLHDFGRYGDASSPRHGLVLAGGALYGETYSGGPASGGVVFRLTPPAVGQTAWQETFLYKFGSGISTLAFGGLRVRVVDGVTTVFGTSRFQGTGPSGAVWQLSEPPSKGAAWTYAVIHQFDPVADGGGNGGSLPDFSLIADRDLNVFGVTTSGGSGHHGVAYRLSPSLVNGTGWTYSVLHNFTARPSGPLTEDSSGVLYGTTSDTASYLYRLTSHGGALPWHFADLLDFRVAANGTFPNGKEPSGGLTLAGRSLLGTTSQGGRSPDDVACSGTVYRLDLDR